MKKHNGSVFLLALVLMVLPVQAEGKVDLVVLLDSSKSMFQYYNQVVDYVLTETAREYLRFGDSFHLMSFSDSTQLEIAQVLKTEPDLRSVISRLYLLYPLGRNTDLVTALRNVYQYVDGLPAQSTKHIILITDGMHSPAPGTPYANLDVPAVRDEIDRAAVRIRERGWTMRIVRVPFTSAAASGSMTSSSQTSGMSGSSGAPAYTGVSASNVLTAAPSAGDDTQTEALPSAPGSGDYLADVAAAVGQDIQTFDPDNHTASVEAGVDLHRIIFPTELGTHGHIFIIKAEITNGSKLAVPFELTGLLLDDGTDILFKKLTAELAPEKSAVLELKVRLPDTMPAGRIKLTLEPRFQDGFRVSPARSVVNLTLKSSPIPEFLRSSGGLILLGLLLLLMCGAVLLVIFYIRHAHRKAEEPIVDALLDSATLQKTVAHHTSPYATASVIDAPVGNQRTLKQPSGTSRDSSILQAEKLSAANDSSNSVRKRQEALTTDTIQHHVLPKLILEDGTDSRRDLAQAATLLGTWKNPGSHRIKLPLISESSPQKNNGMNQAPMRYEPRVASPGAVRLIMHVQDQNPNIGKRNIRTMHAGGRASVGGGKSAFLLFLLPVPRELAHLHFDGIDATLVPQKPEFFPDYDSPVASCIGRDIRVVTAKGKELIIRFERYVPPLEKINKLLHCLETPGITESRASQYPEHEQTAKLI